MKLPAYPRYKHSGVEWLGDVPEHWETKKFTHGFSRIGSGTTPRSDSDDFYDGDVPWVTTSELREAIITKTKESVTQSALASHSALRLYPAGTLLFAMYGATIGRLGILGIQATVNQACCAFTEPILFDTRFVFYWLWMRRPILISLSTGGGQPNLSQDDLRQVRISTPPLAEQRAIAAFLDRETGRVDRLVAKKRELIERLKEKRTALISRTVTRGLAPAAARVAGLPEKTSFKPSGLDWLGDIPKHWEVKRLKFVSPHITVGIVVEPSKYYADEGIPALRSLNVKPHRLVANDLVFITPTANEQHVKSKIYEGDLVAVRSGQPGTTAVVDKRFHGANCIDLIIIRKPHGATSAFLDYFLNSDMATAQFETGTGGAIQQHFNITMAASLQILVPPLPEQAAIVAYLATETTKVDTLVGKVEEAVERLQEYRTALITAAVTGKIDVRSRHR
ncbi:MAG: restriction endonuclease subunit S [Nitrospira sp.]|nr:restriction endonuclease subunit S [Nitrospira sp.]